MISELIAIPKPSHPLSNELLSGMMEEIYTVHAPRYTVINLYHARLMMFSGSIEMPRSILRHFFSQSFHPNEKIRSTLAKIHAYKCLTAPEYLSMHWKRQIGLEFLEEVKNYQNFYPDHYRSIFGKK